MTKKKAKPLDGGIWLAVALLVILLLITWALLADMLGKSAAPRDTIALTPQESQKTVYQTLYRPAQAAPAGETQDETVQWESTTDVDLFRASYTNGSGAVTVKSEPGDKVVAPGTTNVYKFSVRNTGNTALQYTISLDGAFAIEKDSIPLQFRLRRGGDWLAGDAQHWCTLAEINACTDQTTLNPDKINEYMLEWQWPFEGTDTVDTALGDITLAADADFRLEITTTAEASADAAAINADGSLLYEQLLTARELALLVLDLCALLGLILLLILRRSVYVCGFVPAPGAELSCSRKKDTVRPDGRFVFPRVHTGKRTFALGDASLTWRLKRNRNVQGIAFDKDGTLLIGHSIRAVELYLTCTGSTLQIDPARWAAVDRKNRVYTPVGVREPDENGSNATPGGLCVDRHKKYTFAAREKASK